MPENGTEPNIEQKEAPAGEPAEKVYKQADVDSIAEKVRQTEARKAAALEKQLADLRDKTMSEQEKAIKAAREEGATAAKAEARAEAIGALIAVKGIKPEAAARLARLANDYEGSALEAVAAFEADFPQFFKTGRPVPDGNDGPTKGESRTTEWTPEAISEAIHNGTYNKYRDEILAYQAKNYTMVTSRAPGEALRKG